MNNFNFSIIEGNLVKDPELKTINDKTVVCKFTVGLNRRYTDKNGESVEQADFFDVNTWNNTARNCAKYLNKGSKVLVSGNLRKDVWKDKDGEFHSRVYIDGRSVNFMSAKPKA